MTKTENGVLFECEATRDMNMAQLEDWRWVLFPAYIRIFCVKNITIEYIKTNDGFKDQADVVV